MSRFAAKTIPLMVAVIVLSACSGMPGREAPQPASGASSVVAAPVASAVDPASRMQGFQLARRHDDVVRIDGRNVRQVVEYGFDYDRAATVRRIFSPDGELVAEEILPAESLRANPAEQERLQELVRTHPVLGPMLDQPDLLVHAGGFVVREPDDPYCGLRSRCLRYIVSRGDGSIPYIHAVVDLVSDRVVHPFYDDKTPATKANQEPVQ